MTYTREEWEPAATEASKVPEGELRSALLKAYIEISELREKLGPDPAHIIEQEPLLAEQMQNYRCLPSTKLQVRPTKAVTLVYRNER